MSAPAGGPWTRHGHDIPGVTVAGAGRPAAIARCGGPALCRKCAEDVQQAGGAEALPIAPSDVLAAHAVTKLRSHAEEHDDDEIEALLAEYERRGAELLALRAELDRRDRYLKVWQRGYQETSRAARAEIDRQAVGQRVLDNATGRLICIADAHQEYVDKHGGTDGDCAECGHTWPCPSHVWATTKRTSLDPWNPIDDEDEVSS